MNQESKSYIYTNWRGKSFIIDDKCVEKLKKSLIEDGVAPEAVENMTPESVMTEVPDMERWERHFQLEEMWEKPAS